MPLSAAERARRRAQALAAQAAAEEALAGAFAAALDRVVSYAAGRALLPPVAADAGPPGGPADGPEDGGAAFVDLDALGIIPERWAAEVAANLVPALAAAFAEASARLLADFPAAAEARAAARLHPLADTVGQMQADWLEAASNRLVGIGDGVWSRVRSSLAEGFAARESIPQMRDRVRELTGAGRARARTIARTEATGAANGGQHAAAAALGRFGPTTKEWMATEDARTRETHARAAGQRRALSEPFDVGGHLLDYPGDPMGPAGEVVNCRCTLIYLDEPADAVREERGDGPPEAVAASLTIVPPDPEEPTMSVRERRYHDVVRHIFAPPPAAVPTVDEAPAAPAETTAAPAPPPGRPFEALLCVEGRWTGDDRHMLPGALRWDGLLPFPLTLGHSDDPRDIVAHVAEIERIPNGPDEAFIVGRGFLDDVGEQGVEAIRQIELGNLRGVSVDIDDVELGGVDPATATEDELFWSMVVEDARLRALALVPIGAFAEAYITLGEVDTSALPPAVEGPAALPAAEAEALMQDLIDEAEDSLPILLVASAGPGVRVVRDAPAGTPSRFSPPASAFARPEADGPCPLTVTPEDEHGIRYVFGHVAEWGVCHIGFPDACVEAPPSPTGYAYFNLVPLLCADGSYAHIGHLTVGTGHADRGLGWQATVDHYDHTGTSAALVSVSDGEHGVWACGIVDPLATEETAWALATHPLSGDWRNIGGQLELVAALSVNVPGFPNVRTRISNGVQTALVAAGVVGRDPRPRAGSRAAGARAAAARLAASIGRDPASRAAALAARVHG